MEWREKRGALGTKEEEYGGKEPGAKTQKPRAPSNNSPALNAPKLNKLLASQKK